MQQYSMKALPIVTLIAACIFTSQPTVFSAETDVAGLTQEANGTFTFHGLKFQLLHNDGSWRASDQSTAQAESTTSDGGKKYTGTMDLQDNESLKFNEVITPNGANEFTVSYSVDLPSGITTNGLSVSFKIPAAESKGQTISYDGNSIVLPESFANQQLLANKISSLAVPVADGRIVIEGTAICVIQDNRKWNLDNFECRSIFLGDGQTRDLSLTFRFEPR